MPKNPVPVSVTALYYNERYEVKTMFSDYICACDHGKEREYITSIMVRNAAFLDTPDAIAVPEIAEPASVHCKNKQTTDVIDEVFVGKPVFMMIVYDGEYEYKFSDNASDAEVNEFVKITAKKLVEERDQW